HVLRGLAGRLRGLVADVVERVAHVLEGLARAVGRVGGEGLEVLDGVGRRDPDVLDLVEDAGRVATEGVHVSVHEVLRNTPELDGAAFAADALDDGHACASVRLCPTMPAGAFRRGRARGTRGIGCVAACADFRTR